MIEIDGAYGEGGGQILRTALALSALTQLPFRARQIRQHRSVPGLKPQHLHCIRALQSLSGARVESARLGATAIAFYPGRVAAREVQIDIGTAGSVTLLLQAVLLPALFAAGPVGLILKGGTDTRWSIPLDYFVHVIVPHLSGCAEITIRQTHRGFYPRGGGVLSLRVEPRVAVSGTGLSSLLDAVAAVAEPLQLSEPPTIAEIRGNSVASQSLRRADVARRQAEGARSRLGADYPVNIREEYVQTASTGTVVTLWGVGADGRCCFGGDALGQKGIPAEAVGSKAAGRLLAAMRSGAGLDHHLADNLIPLMALTGGRMVPDRITGHIRSNVYVCDQFFGPRVTLNERRGRIEAEGP